MSEKFKMRQGDDSLWEVVDGATGEVVKLAGVLLSSLDAEAAQGALSVLLNKIVEPNGSGSAEMSSDDDGEPA